MTGLFAVSPTDSALELPNFHHVFCAAICPIDQQVQKDRTISNMSPDAREMALTQRQAPTHQAFAVKRACS
jgi:hypothetical protein